MNNIILNNRSLARPCVSTFTDLNPHLIILPLGSGHYPHHVSWIRKPEAWWVKATWQSGVELDSLGLEPRAEWFWDPRLPQHETTLAAGFAVWLGCLLSTCFPLVGLGQRGRHLHHYQPRDTVPDTNKVSFSWQIQVDFFFKHQNKAALLSSPWRCKLLIWSECVIGLLGLHLKVLIQESRNNI